MLTALSAAALAFALGNTLWQLRRAAAPAAAAGAVADADARVLAVV